MTNRTIRLIKTRIKRWERNLELAKHGEINRINRDCKLIYLCKLYPCGEECPLWEVFCNRDISRHVHNAFSSYNLLEIEDENLDWVTRAIIRNCKYMIGMYERELKKGRGNKKKG